MSYKDPLWVTPPTRYARRFTEKQWMNRPTGRSQWSPIDAFHPTYQADPNRRPFSRTEREKIKFDRSREKKQKEKLFGYTTRELTDMDCLATRQLKQNNLRGAILPCLDFDHWEHAPNKCPDFERDEFYYIDLHRPEKGVWAANNPLIWRHLQPCLILASRILSHSDTLAFIQSIFQGKEEPVAPERIPTKYQQEHPDLHLFNIPVNRRVSRAEQATIRQRVDHLFSILDERMHLGFMAQRWSPTEWEEMENAHGLSNNVQHESIADDLGKSITHPACTRFWIWINYDTMEPLLRDDLDDAERFGLQWFMAATLVHEVMHTLWRAYMFEKDPHDYIDIHLGGKNPWTEPYYNGSAVAELGWQMETDVYGGHGNGFRGTAPGGPLGYWFLSEWPTVLDVSTHQKSELMDQANLLTPEVAEYQIIYPIPVSYFEDVFRETFWTAGVHVFGMQLLHAKNLRNGVKVFFEKYKENEGAFGFVDKWTLNSQFESMRRRFDELADYDMLELNEVQMAEQTPEQRTAFLYTKRMIKTARLEQSYQEGLERIEQSLMEIMKEMENEYDWIGFAGDNARLDMCYMVLTGLTEAIKIHFRVIGDLMMVEKLAMTYYSDWRRSLITWNTGVRLFVNDMHGHAKFQHIRDQLTSLALMLEISRMFIWYDGPQSCTGNDGLEIKNLETAAQALRQSDWYLFDREMRSVSDRKPLSLYAVAARAVIIGAWRQRLPKNERLVQLNNGLQGLKELVSVGESIGKLPQKWSERIEADIKDATNLIQATVIEPDIVSLGPYPQSGPNLSVGTNPSPGPNLPPGQFFPPAPSGLA